MMQFDETFGDFNVVNLDNFFEDIQRGAMESGYELFLTHGIDGMKREMGSKNPISLAKKLIEYFIAYEEYEKCAELQKIIDGYKKQCQTK